MEAVLTNGVDCVGRIGIFQTLEERELYIHTYRYINTVLNDLYQNR